MKLDNKIELNINKDLEISKKSESNLKNGFNSILNSGMDLALKTVLPDFIEDQIIEIKDVIMEEGLKDGVKTLYEDFKDFFKTIFGKNDNFLITSEINSLTKRGGFIDELSKGLSKGLDYAKEKNIISDSTAKILKSGKTSMIKTFSNELKSSVLDNLKDFDKLDKYVKKWNENYEKKDFQKMERNAVQIEKLSESVLPFSKLIDETTSLLNIHNYIRDNKTFDISKNELDVLKKI